MPPRRAPAPSTPLAAAKADCRAALMNARLLDGLLAPMCDRLYAETLMVVDGAAPEAKLEMWRRMRILFEIIGNRKTWPLRVR
jgi:hypothetical protein